MHKAQLMFLLSGAFLLALCAGAAEGGDNQYVGAEKCKNCHNAVGNGDQFSVWMKSHHHTLPGFEKAKATAKKPPGKGCSACHGAGSLPAALKVKDSTTLRACSARPVMGRVAITSKPAWPRKMMPPASCRVSRGRDHP